jgi:hypothetical protein
MTFCTSCGRERSGTTRFCTWCGTEFHDAPEYEPTVRGDQPRPEGYDPPGQDPSAPSADAWAPTGPYGGAPGQAPYGAAPGQAPYGSPPGQAPYGGPGGQGPYGSPGGNGPDQDEFGDTFMGLDNFRETMTAGPAYAGPAYAEPAPAAPAHPDPAYVDPTAQLPAYAQPGYAEPGYPQPGYPQPGYGGPGQPGPGGPAPARRPPGRRNKGIFIAVAVIAFLAVGGGAYALVANHSHGSAAPPTPSTSISATQSAPASPTAPTTAPPTSAPASTSSGTVAVSAAAAGNGAAPQVTAFLNSYFTAINAHDYQAYDSLLDQQLQPYPQSSFDAGYGSTTDSDETLTSITDTGSGGEAASVTFTSHQQPAESPDNSSCDQWSITLFLVPNGNGYLEGAAPSTYHAAYQAC